MHSRSKPTMITSVLLFLSFFVNVGYLMRTADSAGKSIWTILTTGLVNHYQYPRYYSKFSVPSECTILGIVHQSMLAMVHNVRCKMPILDA